MKIKIIIFSLLVLTLLILIPFFYKGFFETDDGQWAIVRQSSMHRELRDGQFPVRWSSDLNFGYGYPLFNFSYPGPYYMGEIFHLLGFSFTNTVKLLFITSTLVSVISMFYLSKEIWKNDLVAYLSALIYLSGAYRIVNLYIRGSLGETVALAIFPLLSLCGLKVMTTGKRRFMLGGAILLGILILTHNVMAILFLPLFIYFLIIEFFLRSVKISRLLDIYIQKVHNFGKHISHNSEVKLFTRHIYQVVVMLLVGIGLSAFFWLPAMSEMKYVRIGTTPLANVQQQFAAASNYIISPLDGRKDIAHLKSVIIERRLELAQFLVVVSAIVLIFYFRKSYQLISHRVLLYFFPYLVLLFLLTPLSILFWLYFPGFKLIDFPWRVYALLLFLLPLILAPLAMIPLIRPLIVFITLLLYVVTLQISYPRKFFSYPDTFYSTNQGTTTSADEYFSVWFNSKNIDTPESQIKFFSPHNISVNALDIKGIVKKYQLDNQTNDQVIASVGIMYFPGWNAYLNNIPIKITHTLSNGLIQIKIPPGRHLLELKYQNTPIRYIANLISILTLFYVAIMYIVQYLRNKNFI